MPEVNPTLSTICITPKTCLTNVHFVPEKIAKNLKEETLPEDEREEFKPKEENLVKLEVEELDIKEEESETVDGEESSNNSSPPYNNYKPKQDSSKYKCKICTYEVDNSSCLRPHALSHKIMRQGTRDTSKSSRNKLLKGSQRLQKNGHTKNVPELKTYNCDKCTYKTKVKSNLNHHFLKHVDPQESKMYKCDLCPYKSKKENHLNCHVLTHKTPAPEPIQEPKKPAVRPGRAPLETCDFCEFQTKHVWALLSHMKMHKNLQNKKLYSCPVCGIKTSFKYSKFHLLTHKNVLM